MGVGELEDVRAFYYSIESKNKPKEDPPMLWLTVALVAHGFLALSLKLVIALPSLFTNFYF